MPRERTGECRLRFVEMREQGGVVSREVVTIGFGAHMVDVTREVDLRIIALNGADASGRHDARRLAAAGCFVKANGFHDGALIFLFA